MIKLRALIFAAALAACGQTGAGKGAGAPDPNEPPDPFALQIEIGRYNVMLQQARDLTSELPGRASDIDYTAPTELARSLRHAVWQYNIDRSSLCQRGLFTEVSCGAAYEPVWISEPATVAPTLEELQSRSTAVGEEVMRFWDAVCEDARSRAASDEERQACSIE